MPSKYGLVVEICGGFLKASPLDFFEEDLTAAGRVSRLAFFVAVVP
jgi:hypothetical protein